MGSVLLSNITGHTFDASNNGYIEGNTFGEGTEGKIKLDDRK